MKLILEIERLLLREYVEEDAEAFFKLNTDPEVLRFVFDQVLLNVEPHRKPLTMHDIAMRFGIKIGKDRGAIAAGKLADMILVDDDPTKNIRDITTVM